MDPIIFENMKWTNHIASQIHTLGFTEKVLFVKISDRIYRNKLSTHWFFDQILMN